MAAVQFFQAIKSESYLLSAIPVPQISFATAAVALGAMATKPARASDIPAIAAKERLPTKPSITASRLNHRLNLHGTYSM